MNDLNGIVRIRDYPNTNRLDVPTLFQVSVREISLSWADFVV